jgi:release factor glutamine methyltransferase
VIVEIRKVLRDVAASLAGASDTPRLDAELLMAHAMDVTRSELLLRHLNDPVPDGFTALLKRRLAHEPVAYILGDQEFYGLLFTVSSDVLIPRNDSEVLVEAALADRPEALDVLDCGTGSGALLLAVLSHLPGAKGIGIDRSHEA